MAPEPTDGTDPARLPNDDGSFDPEPTAHRRISDEIAARIESGQYQTGARLPSEPRLATEFGVSRGTLRQALASLRQGGYLDSIAGRGTFVRGPRPRVPESRRRVVGLIVPSVTRPALPEVLMAIEDELHGRGYSLLVGTSGNTLEQEKGRVHRILGEGVSGLIVLPIDGRPDPVLYRQLLDEGFPVVLIDRHIVGLSIDAVLPDNVGGAFVAVSHLIELGHRRIAFISSDNLTTTSVLERLQGYQQALRASDIPVEPELIFARLPAIPPDGTDEDRVIQSNARRIARFLSSRPLPTAVFALHDRIAISVIEASAELGLRVPDDLAIVGFDDDPLAQKLRVPLTTIAQPRDQIGRTAARMIADRIEGRRIETARIVLPTQLVIRRSSGSSIVPDGAVDVAPVSDDEQRLVRVDQAGGQPQGL
jgi:GntR family transcriptional regulator, arabinose operon transcriptional repressor